MAIPLIAAGVTAAAGALTKWISDKRANKARKEEAELAYDRQLEIMNMQNEYNTPANQMQRYQEAGLNPHLMYGQGTPGNTAESSPEYKTPDVQSTPLETMGVLNSVLDMRMKAAQVNNVEMTTRLNAAREINTLIQGEQSSFDLDLDRVLRDNNIMLSNEQKNSLIMLNRLRRSELYNKQQSNLLDFGGTADYLGNGREVESQSGTGLQETERRKLLQYRDALIESLTKRTESVVNPNELNLNDARSIIMLIFKSLMQ